MICVIFMVVALGTRNERTNVCADMHVRFHTLVAWTVLAPRQNIELIALQ